MYKLWVRYILANNKKWDHIKTYDGNISPEWWDNISFVHPWEDFVSYTLSNIDILYFKQNKC
jgi:hypothetical protein